MNQKMARECNPRETYNPITFKSVRFGQTDSTAHKDFPGVSVRL